MRSRLLEGYLAAACWMFNLVPTRLRGGRTKSSGRSIEMIVVESISGGQGLGAPPTSSVNKGAEQHWKVLDYNYASESTHQLFSLAHWIIDGTYR